MQSSIEDVILLEYIWQSDHGEHTTYIYICLNVSCFGIEKHSELYGNGRDGDIIKDMVRNNSIPHTDRKQSFTSAFEEDPMWYFGASKDIDPGPTAHIHISVCHPK
jgi:hypothetical protein